MARELARGTKRWCQGEECGLPFYDLNKSDLVCPNCGARYKVAATVAAVPIAKSPGRKWSERRPATPTDKEADTTAEISDDDKEEADSAEIVSLDDLLEPDEPDDADVTGTSNATGNGTD